MSQVRWHYEYSINEESSLLKFFFKGVSAYVEAYNLCDEDDEGNDLAERFVNGDEVEVPLGFNHCSCSDPLSLEALGCSPEELGGLLIDHDACKTVHDESLQDYQDLPDEFFEEMEDDFYGSGVVRRLPPQDGNPGEIRFEVDRDTATGIGAQLLNNRSLADFLTYRIFYQIAPESFSGTALRINGPEDAKVRCFADRLEPPTNSKTCLTDRDFVELLKNLDSRISYRQLCMVLPCKPQTMKGYLVNAGLAEKGVRLTSQTFSAAELVSDLVPYLQRLSPLGEKAYRLRRLFDNAGYFALDSLD